MVTSRELSASDEDTPPSEIVYLIVEHPVFGVIEHKAYPDQQLTSFTQGRSNHCSDGLSSNEIMTRFVISLKSISLHRKLNIS